MATSVLRVRRTDDDGFVVLHVQQPKPSKLDFELSGTDGESPFVGSISHGTISSLRNKAYKGASDEWESVLLGALIRNPGALAEEALRNVEMTASVGKRMSLAIRKNIDGITQRLGDISLDLNEDAEISLFDWTAESSLRVDELQKSAISLQSRLKGHENTIAELRSQLESATTASKEHEDDLLEKFAALLNSKKLKIRDQQRLLAKANIETDAEMHDAEDDVKPTKTQQRKRKAELDEPAAAKAEQDEDAMTDATERTETPDLQSEAEDSDRHDGDLERPALQSDQPSHSQRPEKNGAASSQSSKTMSVPPRRELPFNKKDGDTTSESASADQSKALNNRAQADDEDETDDEL